MNINPIEQKKKAKRVFLIGSRTGGPLVPLLAVKDDLQNKIDNLKFVIVGIRGGFEDKVSKVENIPILYLPEVKNRSFPEGKPKIMRIVFLIQTKILIIIGLIYSITLSHYYLLKHRPSLILSTSNFLSVPIIWAAASLNLVMFWRKHKIKIAIHQLDPVNTTIKLIKPFADLLSAGFPSVVSGLGPNARLVPNPIRYSVFESKTKFESLRKLIENNILADFNNVNTFKKNTTMSALNAELKKKAGEVKILNQKKQSKPLLLVFGGGSGAEFINEWVWRNVEELTNHFVILHLTGFLQAKEAQQIKLSGYFQHEGLTDLMADAYIASDYVIARAGMSTISELLYLGKQAFLIPIPDSHQEANADLVNKYFRVWTQSSSESWLNELIYIKSEQLRLNQQKFDYYNKKNLEDYSNMLSAFLS